MEMTTIREELARRNRWTALLGALGGASMFVLGYVSLHFHTQAPVPLIFLVFGVVVVGAALSVLQTRCLECSAWLGWVEGEDSPPTVDFCPRCGVSFDKPIPLCQKPER
jgi:hypothetical protein